MIQYKEMHFKYSLVPNQEMNENKNSRQTETGSIVCFSYTFMEGESPPPNSWNKGELVAWAQEGGQKKVQQKYTSDVGWIRNKQRVVSLFGGIRVRKLVLCTK